MPATRRGNVSMAGYGRRLAGDVVVSTPFEVLAMGDRPSLRQAARVLIARGFGTVEDLIYVGLGLLLASLAFGLLVSSGLRVAESLLSGALAREVGASLDRVLLALLVIELLYTVQVSFREHAIVPEPFLLVGLIAAVRRVLLLTAEHGEAHTKTADATRSFAIEVAVLTVLIVALVGSLVLLRRAGPPIRAERG